MSGLDAAIDRLDPVSLAELTASAALLTRVDRKYALAADDAVRMLDALPAGTRALEIGGERSLAYASCYFDSRDLLAYRLAAHGRRRRFKLRTRTYVDSNLAFLELKTRGGRGTTVKERIEYAPEHRAVLTADGREYASEGLAAVGIPAPPLSPVIETGYRRTTLLLPDGATRATVDTDLAWRLDDGTTLRTPGLVIVETKATGGPGAVDRLLWRAGHRPDRVSKFATGLAALRPELPSNRWHGVLRRCFADAERTAA
ncbi:polyphosphate polymerase domain-containing protein [Agrococcus baldri]|uniref:VTC domain-containing protein n=1 Tax=Agrococcus baldri TaxID=153730 RepID=A0AA87UT05_9MICO|nr:polyphosphate polymerase domain-containing protein [Agrococcus baldri]GEK80955.1 VTC domain-containing protein [Agrococcus baldri]